jgi:hypothetical protein
LLWLRKTEGSVDYCLVNNQYIKSQAQKNSLWYTMGQPDKLADRWLKAAEQLERNMIFDITEFKINIQTMSLRMMF